MCTGSLQNKSANKRPVLLVIKGFVVCIAAYAAGGFFIAPAISSYLQNVPWVTISMLFSSSFSLVIASFYLLNRSGIRPRIAVINRDWLINCLAFIVLMWAIVFVSILFSGNSSALSNEISSIKNIGIFYLSVFVLTIVGPLLEEIFFRGLVLEILNKNTSVFPSVLATSFLFAMLHGIFGVFSLHLVFIFLASVVFSIAYIQCGIVGSVLTHCFANSYLVFVFLGHHSR